MIRYYPRDAERLLLDPSWIQFACDYRKNDQFWHADARTRDCRGQRVIDDVQGVDAIEAASRDLRRTVSALLSGESVVLDPLREKKIPREGRAPRTVHIPTYARRCLSNLGSRVLAETSRYLLPKSVRAYVPGLYDPVPESILDLAEAIRAGKIIYWYKVDFSGFFNCIPHALIEEALVHYGYSKQVVNLVTTCARTPIHRRGPGGTWSSTPNTLGAPMGLSESAALANLVCYEMDEHFRKVNSRVVSVRYSDDSIGGTQHRSEAVGAVRYLQDWAKRHGIGIKGTSLNTLPETLVHGIRRQRLPILGAEIDASGVVHIPMVTLKKKLAEIDEAMNGIELQGDTPVRAVSMYAGGRGTDHQDLDDVKESVEAFVSYWARLNRYEADRFRSVVNKRHHTLSCMTERLGAVWIASLGDRVGSGGGGHRPPDSLTVRSTTTPLPMPGALRAQGTGGVRYVSLDSSSRGNRPTTDRTEGSESLGVYSSSGNTRRDNLDPAVVEINGTNDHHGRIPDVEDECLEAMDTNMGAGWPRVASGGNRLRRGDTGEGSPISLTDTEDDEDNSPDRILDPDGAIRSSQVAVSHRPLLIVEGVTTDPDLQEPPLGSEFVNHISIVVRRVSRSRGGPGSLVFVGYGSSNSGRYQWVPWGLYPNTRRFTATLATVYKVCGGFRGTTLNIALEDADLVKHFCQRRRKFHSPAIYGLVLDLNRLIRERCLSVALYGGLRVEASQQHAIDDAVASQQSRGDSFDHL